MEFQKTVEMSGSWIKAADIASGTKAKLTGEAIRRESRFTDNDGNPKMEVVSKIKLSGNDEELNITLNKASLNALIDAFGTESKTWVGQVLTVQTEKMIVGGKRVTALYLVPEGYEVKEDASGYMVIEKKGYPKYEGEPNFGGEDELDPKSIPF